MVLAQFERFSKVLELGASLVDRLREMKNNQQKRQRLEDPRRTKLVLNPEES
jgi:hypothetical protein